MQITIPFYSKDNFAKITSLLPNSDWTDTYEDWLSKTEVDLRGVSESGDVPVRIDIEPDAFAAWCKENNQPIILVSLSSYCGFILVSGILNARKN